MSLSLRRATIFVMAPNEADPPDYKWVMAWLAKWGSAVVVADYSTGGYEHTWDVEGPQEAIAEIPGGLLCASTWSGIS